MGDNGALKNLFKGRDDKKPHLERTASGRKKWIKELSSPANLVIDRCCRYAESSP